MSDNEQDVAPGGSPAITALRGPRGVALYQDSRYGFSVAVPGEPLFMTPGKYFDASWALLENLALFRARVIAPPAGESLADAVAKIAREVTQAVPVELPLGQLGVRTAVRATREQPKQVTVVDVLGGGATDRHTWIAVLAFDYDPATLPRFKRDTALGAIVGSAAFSDPVRYMVPPVFPLQSAWFTFDPPFALHVELPPLPKAAPDPALADAILDVVGALPPTRALDDAGRARIEQLLAAAGRLDPAGAVLRSLATVHDVRGLARAIILGC